jgi:hypothetical protein
MHENVLAAGLVVQGIQEDLGRFLHDLLHGLDVEPLAEDVLVLL